MRNSGPVEFYCSIVRMPAQKSGTLDPVETKNGLRDRAFEAEPHALDRVQLGRVGRQRHQGDVVGNARRKIGVSAFE